MTPTCTWTEDDDGYYETSCGEMHVFITGTPSENHYKFCPYCGLELRDSNVQPPREQS